MDWNKEYEERLSWSGDYNGEECEKCGRLRVMLCVNNKRVCEKCRWSPEVGGYVARDYLG